MAFLHDLRGITPNIAKSLNNLKTLYLSVIAYENENNGHCDFDCIDLPFM
ncbi:MAG: hypothetical protein JSW28_05510 [Thermoplasmata archaeon]|nr:MAG: hypothetical protein JSW28_05510 [Thermoplasmata archaeon]